MTKKIFPHASRSQHSPPTRLFLGLLLIGIGIIFTLEQAGIVSNAQELLRFWPAIFIVLGLSKLIWPSDPIGRISGLVFVAAGIWLLLAEWGMVRFNLWNLWPLVLVIIGIRIVWQGFFGRSGVSDDTSSTVGALAILGGTARASAASDFKGGDLVAVLGSCDVDLRQAGILDGPAVIDAFTFWGGIDIKVPENWTVTVRGIPLLGGFDDETVLVEDSNGFRQELVVKGFAIMGGVEIRN